MVMNLWFLLLSTLSAKEILRKVQRHTVCSCAIVISLSHVFIILCAYTQQGYAFGGISLCTYVRICVYICQQKRLFSALLLANFLLSVICCLLFEFKRLQCGLLHPASCTTEQLMLFQIRCLAPLTPKYFFLSYNGTPHPLG